MAGQIIARGKSTWMIRVFVGRDDNGKRLYHNQTIRGTKRDAQDVLSKLLLESSTGALKITNERRVIGTLLDDLLADYKINGKDYEWAGRVVNLQLRPAFGELAISKLGTSLLNRYIEKRKAEGRANATINNELALLRRAFHLGAACEPPKVSRVPRIAALKVNNVRKGFFEHAEYLRMRDALPAEVRPVVTFAYYTGCRRGEILSLTWAQVDLEAGMIRLEAGTTKNDEGRTIPILTPELKETLKMQHDTHDYGWPESPWVFSRKGQPILDFKNAWGKAQVSAKLPGKLFHDLRRTGVRNLVRAGVPEAVAMRISGHKTRSVFDRYNIVSGSDLTEAGRSLTRYMEEKNGASGTPDKVGTLLAHNEKTMLAN